MQGSASCVVSVLPTNVLFVHVNAFDDDVGLCRIHKCRHATPRAAFRAGAAAVINADAATLRFVACTAALVACDLLFDGGFFDVAVDQSGFHTRGELTRSRT